MNVDDGYIRELKDLQDLRKNEVLIPKEEEEQVINMNRQQRRAWARKQKKLNGK